MKLNKILFVGSITAAVLITIISTLFAAPYLPSIESVTSFGAAPEGTFYQPRDVAINGSNWIFVADTQNGRVQLFNNETFAFVKTIGFKGNNATDGSLFDPYGIFVNSTDFIYVADTFNNAIKIYDPAGDFVEAFGGPGQGPGQYFYPSGLDGNGTHVFIADTFNNRIVITNQSGVFEVEIPSP